MMTTILSDLPTPYRYGLQKPTQLSKNIKDQKNVFRQQEGQTYDSLVTTLSDLSLKIYLA